MSFFTKKDIVQEPVIFLFRKMWKFSKGNRRSVVMYFIFFVLANLALLLDPLVIGMFLNELQTNGLNQENFGYITLLLLGPLGVTLIFWLFHGVARVLEEKNAFIVRMNYQKYLLDNLLDLDLHWHTDRDSGDIIDKVNRGSNALYQSSASISDMIKILTAFTGTLGVLLWFNIPISIIVLFFISISLGIIFRFDKELVPQYKELALMDNKISASIFDTLSNITSITILRIKKVVLGGVYSAIGTPQKLFGKNFELNETKWAVSAILVRITIIIPLILYMYVLLRDGDFIEIGTITALYLYLERMSQNFFTFTYSYGRFIRHKTQVQNAEILEDDFITKKCERVDLRGVEKLILRNTHFIYGEDQEAQRHLDVDEIVIKKGERIAVIGESGSGKTTFLKVLHGLYPQAKTDLFVEEEQKNGTFSEVDLGTTLVPQEPELFSSSIRENITFGVEYSDEEITQFTNMAHFTEVIQKLPKGLDSIVNEKGVNLSGGQKQRLALARALLFAQNKEIILLDESTSSVDPSNEMKIYENIFEFFSGKTIIASIHKMNLLKQFDRIILFEDGKVIDDGTFDDLLKDNEKFQTMWNEYMKHL